MTTMRWGVLGVFSLLVLAPCAWAHGGQYRGPGGAVRPKLRDPYDPPPPPPPPPTDPSTTPGSTPGTPGDPTPGGTPAPVPPVTPGGSQPDLPSSGGGKRSPLTYESWEFWYGNNKEGLERLKEAIYTPRTSDNPVAVLGGSREPSGSVGGITQPTITKVKSHVIPALVWAMDPANARDPDVEGAAYIALAKVTQDPADIERLLRGLVPRRDGVHDDPMVRECAALALGLLCRRAAADQFSAVELDRVRDRLFDAFEDDRGFETRTRGFAALSLGLLGDQPTGPSEDPEGRHQAALATTRRLYDLLRRDAAAEDLPIGVLLALGLQAPKNVPAEVLQGLMDGALRARLAGREVSGIVQSYAVLALARLGDVRAARPLASLLTARATHVHVRRSAAIGLGLLGRLLPSEERVLLARSLRDALEKASDATTQNFGLMSLAYLAGYDADEGRTGVLDDARVGPYLLAEAGQGPVGQRPFAALALGWIGREIGDHPTLAALAAYRQAATAALRDGLAAKALEPRNRAAYAVALGMLGDTGSRGTLLALAGDRHEDRDLRGFAAVGLGLMGPAAAEVGRTLRALLAERVSEDVTLHAATALGLVRDAGAVDLLVLALGQVESQNAKGQIVLALSKIGDARAVEPLVALLRDARASASTRAMACSGLGAVGDLQWIPSLSKVSRDLNYRASVDLVTETLSIL